MVGETLEQASRMGAPRAVALCRNFGGYLSFQSGRWDEAEGSLRAALETYRAHGAASGHSLTLQRLGVLLTARGRIDEALHALDEGVLVAERATMRSHCLTRLYASIVRNRLAAGDLEAADQNLELGHEEARRHGNCASCNGLLLPESVRVHVALDRIEAARGDVERLEAIAEKFGSRAWVAMARHARGRYALATGDLTRAVEALREAEQAYAHYGDVYEVARARVARSRTIESLEARAELVQSARELLAGLGTDRLEGELSGCL